MTFQTELKNYVEANPKLVRATTTSREGVFVLKYSRNCFFDSEWNDFTRQCRGAVIDKDYNPISLPFVKIHNYGVEAESPVIPSDTMVTAWRKINGFMVAVTAHNDELLVSTTGTIDSDYVGYARELIDNDRYLHVCRQFPEVTFLFECVHPSDPHIVPEKAGMYLLATRKKHWGSDVSAVPRLINNFRAMFGSHHVQHYEMSLRDLLDYSRYVKHEGFVFYTADGVAAKVKSPYYLICKALARKKDIMSLSKQNCDEEFYPLLDFLADQREEFNALPEQDRLTIIRNYLEGAVK